MDSYTALLGGSFNPPHIGHFRIACEVMEACDPARLLFIPSAVPPHKPAEHLLPFTMRQTMLQRCLDGHERMAVSSLEHERPGPSFTVDTLRALHRQGFSKLLFIMGLDDLPLLPTWKEWEQITELADIALLPRTCRCDADVLSMATPVWPRAEVAEIRPDGCMRLVVGPDQVVWYIPQPVLEVSSSLVRTRWLAGRSIEHLVPYPVRDFLRENAAQARTVWTA